MNNFLYDVQDLYPLQKEKRIKKQRKGLGPDYISTKNKRFFSLGPSTAKVCPFFDSAIIEIEKPC